MAHIEDTRPRPAAGVGLRFRLTPTSLNASGDIAVGQEGPFAYLTIGEAF